MKAWAFIDPELALRQARERDRAESKGAAARRAHRRQGHHRHATTCRPTWARRSIATTARRRTRRASRWCARRARSSSARPITCEFAGLTPNVTRNPHDPARTPGGSSSGSAAAVADHMVHVAFGTQTGGSVLRPASFCGVVGYKPTYNLISRDGMKFAAESRDTIGLFARTVEDVDLVASVLTGREPSRNATTRRRRSRSAARISGTALRPKPSTRSKMRRSARCGGELARGHASREFRRARRSAHRHQPVRARARARA